MNGTSIYRTKHGTIRVLSPQNGIPLFEIAIVDNEPIIILKKPQENKYEFANCDDITSLILRGVMAANMNGCVFTAKALTDIFSSSTANTNKIRT